MSGRWTHRSGSRVVPTGTWPRWANGCRARTSCAAGIRAVHGAIGETELGPVVELLTVALGAGGAGTALASSLKTWLLTRRTTAKITVKSGRAGRSPWTSRTLDEVAPLLEQILKAGDDG